MFLFLLQLELETFDEEMLEGRHTQIRDAHTGVPFKRSTAFPVTLARSLHSMQDRRSHPPGLLWVLSG